MGLIVKRGIITNVTRTANHSGRNGNTVTMQDYAWRINNVQCTGKVGTNIGLTNNDEVIVVGKMKNGILKVLALKNLTTGTIVKASTTIPLILGICMFILGILTLLFLVGFILLPIGIYTLYGVYVGFNANRLLEASI